MEKKYQDKFYKKNNMNRLSKAIGVTQLTLLNYKQGVVGGVKDKSESKKNMYYFMLKGWNAYCDEIHAKKD